MADCIIHDIAEIRAGLPGHKLWRETGGERGARIVAVPRANLAGAYLAGADLADADLADADLARADLADARNIPPGLSERVAPKQPDVPVVPHIDAAILAASQDGKLFDMGAWHGGSECGTTHCRAGWAVTLAGGPGKDLETRLGTQRAGALIYRASRPGKRAPWFYAPTERALADIRTCAAADPLPTSDERSAAR